MLANVPNTQVHSHSCTFFSHVPCYVREHAVEEHHRTHSHTYLLTYLHTKKIKNKKIKNKKIKKIDSQLYSWRQNRIFAHTNEFSTCFPHVFHIPTFYPQSFPHFWGSYPHFSGTFPHVFHIFWRVFHTFSTFFWSFPHFTNIHICAYIHKKVGFFKTLMQKFFSIFTNRLFFKK